MTSNRLAPIMSQQSVDWNKMSWSLCIQFLLVNIKSLNIFHSHCLPMKDTYQWHKIWSCKLLWGWVKLATVFYMTCQKTHSTFILLNKIGRNWIRRFALWSDKPFLSKIPTIKKFTADGSGISEQFLKNPALKDSKPSGFRILG